MLSPTMVNRAVTSPEMLITKMPATMKFNFVSTLAQPLQVAVFLSTAQCLRPVCIPALTPIFSIPAHPVRLTETTSISRTLRRSKKELAAPRYADAGLSPAGFSRPASIPSRMPLAASHEVRGTAGSIGFGEPALIDAESQRDTPSSASPYAYIKQLRAQRRPRA
eukprot:IDg5680t1